MNSYTDDRTTEELLEMSVHGARYTHKLPD